MGRSFLRWVRSRGRKTHAAYLQRWELFLEEEGALTIRPLSPILRGDDLQALLAHIRQADLDTTRRIRFDFSRVRQLAGPWGMHFALLIHFVREMSIQVCVSGLNDQPAAMAWIFRSSPELRDLIV